MTYQRCPRLTVSFFLALCCAGSRITAQQDVIPINRYTTLIPIALEGYTGEAYSVLRFDLGIQGFDVTTADQAQYLLSGHNNSSVVGRLTKIASKESPLSKEYTGGTVRAEAHALADAVVETVFPRQKGIGRTKIVYRAERGQNSEIYVADYDGANAVQVTADRSINRDPAWGPGRKKLYYTSYKAGNSDIYVHDLQDGIRQVFARYPGMNAGAAPSPDGARVAMTLSKNGRADIYVCNTDRQNLRQLTTKGGASSPCWSPNSGTICYSSFAEGRSALYLVSSAGGTSRRLNTVGAIGCTEPDWSPDGSTILFTRSIPSFQLCTVPAAGGSARVLDFVSGEAEDASWALNSRTVIFTRRERGRRVLSLLDVPTKQVKDIQQVSGNCSQACWAP
jgi:TolB protein